MLAFELQYLQSVYSSIHKPLAVRNTTNYRSVVGRPAYVQYMYTSYLIEYSLKSKLFVVLCTLLCVH